MASITRPNVIADLPNGVVIRSEAKTIIRMARAMSRNVKIFLAMK